MKNLVKSNFKKTSLSIFIALSMLLCSVFFNSKIIESSFADGDMEYAVDNAGVLTTEELESLKSKLAQISDENNMDVGIVTVDYLDGKSAQEFANDLFEQKKFGKGENRDGILLLVATEDREWAMSTHGSAKEAYNQDGLDFLSGQFLPYLAENDYYSAFENFASNAHELGTMYVMGDPYGEEEYTDEENYPVDTAPVEEEGINNGVWIPLSIVIGCAISLVIMMTYKSQLKSVKSENRADDYLMDMKVVKSQDIFLYRTVTRTMRPKNENHNNDFGGGGGGSDYGGSTGSF